MTAEPPVARTRLIAELRQYAKELDDDEGCEHTRSFGEWCAHCREVAVAAMREAADALAAED